MCQSAEPVATPDGEQFENYIRKALIDELRMSNAYAEKGDVVFTGKLEHIDFNSFKGQWDIKLHVSSNKGISFTVEENYNYKTAFLFATKSVCDTTAQAFMPAVQNLIKSIVSHPDFKRIVAVNN